MQVKQLKTNDWDQQTGLLVQGEAGQPHGSQNETILITYFGKATIKFRRKQKRIPTPEIERKRIKIYPFATRVLQYYLPTVAVVDDYFKRLHVSILDFPGRGYVITMTMAHLMRVASLGFSTACAELSDQGIFCHPLVPSRLRATFITCWERERHGYPQLSFQPQAKKSRPQQVGLIAQMCVVFGYYFALVSALPCTIQYHAKRTVFSPLLFPKHL